MKVRAELGVKVRRIEFLIQALNIGFLLAIVSLGAAWILWPKIVSEEVFNVSSGAILLLNIYVSATLTRRASAIT